MSKVESAIIPTVPLTSTWRLASTWIGASLIAVPVGVLLHELGHLLAYLVFGFPGVVLHYSSASYPLEKTLWQQIYRGDLAAAASMIPLWKVAVATATGILVTYVVTILCCLFAAKKGPQPLAIALGIFAPLRFLSCISTIPVSLSGRPVRAGTDEAHLAALTGIPPSLLVFVGLLFLLLAWIWMVRIIPKGDRWVSLGGLVSGFTLGAFLYFWVIGPWLLP